MNSEYLYNKQVMNKISSNMGDQIYEQLMGQIHITDHIWIMNQLNIQIRNQVQHRIMNQIIDNRQF